MLAIKNLDIKSTNPVCEWQSLYNAIGRCNAIIQSAEDVLSRDKTFTQKACDAYIAEAIWVRSLCYFYLVRTFRDVPYITEPYLNDSQEFRVPKTDGKQIMGTIAKDLRSCAQQIPVSYSPGSWENKGGRGTVWALYALLADIYLWLEDYEGAITMCENIEKAGLYSLLSTENWYSLYYPGIRKRAFSNYSGVRLYFRLTLFLHGSTMRVVVTIMLFQNLPLLNSMR